MEYAGSENLCAVEGRIGRVGTKSVEMLIEDTVSAPRRGTPVSATLTGAAGVISFESVVEDRTVTDRQTLLYLSRPTIVSRVQRRENFRVPVQIPIVLTMAYPSDDGDTMYRGVIQNLSGGGFRIAMPIAPATSTVLRARIPLFPIPEITFLARVIYSGPLDSGEAYAQCLFIDIPEETRNLVINHCFGLERAARNRG